VQAPKSPRVTAIWVTLVVLVVLALYIGLFFIPNTRKIRELRRNEEDLARQVADMEIKNRQLPFLRDSMGAMKDASKRVNELIPEEMDQRRILFYLNEDAVKHNLSLDGFELHSPVAHPLSKVAEDKKGEEEKALDKSLVTRLRVVTYKLTLSGKYTDVLSFIDDLKGSNRLLCLYHIVSPQDRPKGEEVDYVAIAVDGEAYFYAPAAPSAQEQPAVDPFTKFLQAEQSPHVIQPGTGTSSPPSSPAGNAPSDTPPASGGAKPGGEKKAEKPQEGK